MPSKPLRSSKVKNAVFALFGDLEKKGIRIDDVQLSDIQPLFDSMGRPCSANTLYIYRFMYKNPGKFEKMQARAEAARKQMKEKK